MFECFVPEYPLEYAPMETCTWRVRREASLNSSLVFSSSELHLSSLMVASLNPSLVCFDGELPLASLKGSIPKFISSILQ